MIRCLLLAVLALWSAPAQAQRSVSITLDDLPYVGRSLGEATAATTALLAALEAQRAPAAVFVEGDRVEVEGETEARRALVRRWRGAGHAVENHGYGHLSFNDTSVPVYLADVARGSAVVATALGAGGPRFFRAPYNQTGPTPEAGASLRAMLAARGEHLAPFTIEHSDWIFNAIYEDAFVRADTALAGRIGQAYLAHLDTAFAFAERLSAQTFARPISHVLLLHANRINARYLGAMLARLRGRGYAFVSFTDAMSDPAYTTPDVYVGRWGISWLHRWRVGLGYPNALRFEPEPPAWVVESQQALGR